MKKIVLSFFALTMLLSVSFAAEKDPFQFGVRMGAQFSKIKGEGKNTGEFESKYSKALVGPAFGFLFEIPVNAYFEIRPELNFGSQGQRFKSKDLVYSYWMGYVQVPVLLRGQYGNDKVRGFVHVGPQIGYGTFILDRFRGNNIKTQKESYSFKDMKLKPFDAGMTFGAGAEFPSAKGMEIEARYYHGLTDINDTGIKSFKTRNSSVHLTVALKF